MDQHFNGPRGGTTQGREQSRALSDRIHCEDRGVEEQLSTKSNKHIGHASSMHTTVTYAGDQKLPPLCFPASLPLSLVDQSLHSRFSGWKPLLGGVIVFQPPHWLLALMTR